MAWIETTGRQFRHTIFAVATREGGVDRNVKNSASLDKLPSVATREGGVDRNYMGRQRFL